MPQSSGNGSLPIWSIEAAGRFRRGRRLVGNLHIVTEEE
jgi:hypothetical protein